MNIGIVGYEKIGQVIEANFEDKCIVGVYDERYSAQDGPQFSSSIVKLAKGSDFVFITLPITIDGDGVCDSILIDKAMSDILVEANIGESSPIVIISTVVPPSVISKYLSIYRENQFVISTEFINDPDKLDEDNIYFKLIGGGHSPSFSVCDLYENYGLLKYKKIRVGTHLDVCFVNLTMESVKFIINEHLYQVSEVRNEISPTWACYSDGLEFADWVKDGIIQHFSYSPQYDVSSDNDAVKMLRHDGFVIDHEFGILEKAWTKFMMRKNNDVS